MPSISFVRWRNAPPKGDAADFHESGQALDALLEAAEPWSSRHDEDAKEANAAKKASRWPAPPAAPAFQGLAGQFVELIDPHTEADPAVVLLQFMIAFGNAAGSGPHCLVGATRHGINEFGVVVGDTSKARKGDSWTPVESLLGQVDPRWQSSCIKSGTSTGEGIIHALHDVPDESTGEDAGDKRLLLVEAEYARVLKALERTGNTLSAVARDAWDGRALRVLTKGQPETATGAHVSIVGHITVEELRRTLPEVETANGFGNRFLFGLARRSKLLPSPEPLRKEEMAPLVVALREKIALARPRHVISRDAAAERLWAQVYEELSEPKDGLVGALLARSEAHVLRLSALYALLDGAVLVHPEHLQGALELWAYCERSVMHIFGSSLGDPVADTIIHALESGPLTRSEIYGLFGRHVTEARLNAVKQRLVDAGLIRIYLRNTGGRPVEVWEVAQ